MVNAHNLMILVAVVCFMLAALGVPALGLVGLVPLGLAFYAGSHFV